MTAPLQEIRRAFDAFKAQARKDPTSGDDLLNEAYDLVEAALEGTLTPELARLAHKVYGYKGKLGWAKRVQLHRRRLEGDLDDKERFWSWWEMVDALAVLRRSKETVEEQERLYRWAREVSPHEFALKALDDTTQARCWSAERRLDDWFQLYEEAAQILDSPEVSKYRRCSFLQAGMEVSRGFGGDTDSALRYLDAMEQANDDPEWSGYFRFWMAGIENRLLIHWGRDEEAFDAAAEEALTYIDAQLEKRDGGQSIDISKLRWACHNIGCCMLWSGRFQRAADILEKAIQVEDSDAHTHFFLSAAVWAGEKDKEKTLRHLKRATDFTLNTNRGMIGQNFLNEYAFKDVRGDAEFRAATGLE